MTYNKSEIMRNTNEYAKTVSRDTAMKKEWGEQKDAIYFSTVAAIKADKTNNSRLSIPAKSTRAISYISNMV